MARPRTALLLLCSLLALLGVAAAALLQGGEDEREWSLRARAELGEEEEEGEEDGSLYDAERVQDVITKDLQEFLLWRNKTLSRLATNPNSSPNSGKESFRRILRSSHRWTGTVAKLYGVGRHNGKKEEKESEEEEPLDFSAITPAGLKEAIRMNAFEQTDKNILERELEDITGFKLKLLSELAALRELRGSLEELVNRGKTGGQEESQSEVGEAANSKQWMDRLLEQPHWTVNRNYEGVPGVDVLAHERSYACLLVVKGACTFQLPAGTAYWYSSAGANLTRIVNGGDVCGQFERLQADNSGLDIPRHLRENEQEGTTAKVAARNGELLSAEGKEAVLSANRAKLQTPKKSLARALVVSDNGDEMEVLREVGALAEVSNALAEGLKLAFGDPLLPDLLIHFSHGVRKEFPETIRVLTGWSNTSTTEVLKEEGAAMCFDEVIFPINRAFSRGEPIERFKSESYALVSHAYASVLSPPISAPNYQVTWLWHEGAHKISNVAEVQKLLFQVFKGTPIAVVNLDKNDNFVQMVDVMRRTAVLVAMKGFSLLPLMFMPSGGSVVELLPPKVHTWHCHAIAREFGLHHTHWASEGRNSSYSDACFKEEWLSLSPSACEKETGCSQCVNGPSLTEVDISELERVLLPVKVHAARWISEQHPVMA